MCYLRTEGRGVQTGGASEKEEISEDGERKRGTEEMKAEGAGGEAHGFLPEASKRNKPKL